MKVRVTLAVMGNDRSYVGTVSRECEGEGAAQMMVEVDKCYAELSTSPLMELVLQKGETADSVAGVSPDKLLDGVVAMKEYKERASGKQDNTTGE